MKGMPVVASLLPLLLILTCRHKFTLNVSADGNYKLQLKKKVKSDPDDFALNDGNTYFSPSRDFKEYVKLIKSDKAEEVTYQFLQQDCTMLMNKNSSRNVIT